MQLALLMVPLAIKQRAHNKKAKLRKTPWDVLTAKNIAINEKP